MGKVRRNFYIGVRTPWALANERVWNATHRFAAKTFVAGGLVGLALTAAGLNGRPVIVVLLAGALVPIVYSLFFISNWSGAESSKSTFHADLRKRRTHSINWDLQMGRDGLVHD